MFFLQIPVCVKHEIILSYHFLFDQPTMQRFVKYFAEVVMLWMVCSSFLPDGEVIGASIDGSIEDPPVFIPATPLSL